MRIRQVLCAALLLGGLFRDSRGAVAASPPEPAAGALESEFGTADTASLVREYRLRFQEAMADATTEAVERLTGCNVLGYHSQIVFDPEYAFEIFVLDCPPRR